MSTRLNEFQIYLLSKMSNVQLVDDALTALGTSRAQMPQIATAFAAASKIDDIGHRADIYVSVLGPAATERAVPASGPDDRFVGSIRRTWRLPTWPKVDFVVNEHPEGWAWGECFEQPEQDMVPAKPDTISPWLWCENVLVAAAQSQELIDRWTDYLDVKLAFNVGDEFVARFDFGLLQTWRRV